MIEIEVVLDEQYIDPHVTIRTRANTQQIENIICAIENSSQSDFPQIAAYSGDRLVFVSQRDIVRVHTQGRKVVIETEDNVYTVKRTLAGLEDIETIKLLPLLLLPSGKIIWPETTLLS